MSDVFVSYTREDRARVEQLAKALEARGFDVWWDPELLPGEQYATKITKVLADCKAVLVCWSNASIARPWVLDEASVGRDRGVLVPVLIERVDAPLGFRQMQAEDLSGWPAPAHEANFERIVRALEGLRGAPAAPKPASPFPPPPPAHKEGFGFMRQDNGAQADGTDKPKSNKALFIVGGVVLAVLGLVAIGQVIGGKGGGSGVEQASTPGASDNYGLTDKEFASLALAPLIDTALQRTTIDAITKGANEGDAKGQLLMCLAYDGGKGVQADAGLARSWCEKASSQGQSFATYFLGLYHREGAAGYPTDLNAAHEMIDTAASANDSRALYDLGCAYLNGLEGYPQDYLKALDYFRRAGEQGYQDAQFNVAWMYENGKGVPQDYATALLWYKKLADEGSAVGIRGVGWMYYNGWGTEKDVPKAIENYQKALDMGDGNAGQLLADLYERGDGVPQNLEEALKLYRRASELGFKDADKDLKRLGYAN